MNTRVAMGSLPYGMFDMARNAADARRYERAESIYHHGQRLVWNGNEVLKALVDKHGGVHIPASKHAALAAVLGPILWGELAAWKISAQLADRLVPLEAKMAATSQAHDEARHFYVMHDYLQLALGDVPKTVPYASERLLEVVLATDDVGCKVLGMQLQVETTALTIFQHLREVRLCPVLTELLPYFERDEARHVGLGTQCLPIMMRSMNRLDGLRMTAFALEVTYWLIAAHRAMDEPLRQLGLEPRRILTLAKSKQMLVFEELWAKTGRSALGDAISRLMEATANAMWPPERDADWRARSRAFARGLRHGIDRVDTSITPAE